MGKGQKHPEVGCRITRTAEEFAYVVEEIISTTEKIIAEIERCTGKQFDLDLALEFIFFLKE